MSNRDDVPTATIAPIHTKVARYAWGDYEVETYEAGAPRDSTLTIRTKKSYPQLDERSTRTVLEIPMGDAEDLLRIVRHALDSRESAR